MGVDSYDDEHQTTGSSNISKATKEWLEVLTEARTKVKAGEYTIHIAFALVNEQVRAGIPWEKCENCGCPFQSKRPAPGRSSGVCSQECVNELDAYYNEGNWQ